MEVSKKAIIIGASLFILGGLSVYLLTPKGQPLHATPAHQQHNSAMQAAIAQIEQKGTSPTDTSNVSETSSIDEATTEMTHAAFLAEAEAHREEKLENKTEAERQAKLLKAKQNSVECKFWRQQQKTTSAAAKIEEKINYYCTLTENTSSSAQPTPEPNHPTAEIN